VLLVEDERSLAGYVAAGLRKHGFAVDVAFDGGEALEKCDVTPYDVVVLDRDLPVVHGDTVCRRLAERGTARVLMLTASDAVEDRVAGLGLGADDYLGKPFAFSELVARVGALSRRSAPARPPVLRAAGIVLDPARRTTERAGRPLHLTPKEWLAGRWADPAADPHHRDDRRTPLGGEHRRARPDHPAGRRADRAGPNHQRDAGPPPARHRRTRPRPGRSAHVHGQRRP
jgi:CheY-like chemotaxis protein